MKRIFVDGREAKVPPRMRRRRRGRRDGDDGRRRHLSFVVKATAGDVSISAMLQSRTARSAARSPATAARATSATARSTAPRCSSRSPAAARKKRATGSSTALCTARTWKGPYRPRSARSRSRGAGNEEAKRSYRLSVVSCRGSDFTHRLQAQTTDNR